MIVEDNTDNKQKNAIPSKELLFRLIELFTDKSTILYLYNSSYMRRTYGKYRIEVIDLMLTLIVNCSKNLITIDTSNNKDIILNNIDLIIKRIANLYLLIYVANDAKQSRESYILYTKVLQNNIEYDCELYDIDEHDKCTNNNNCKTCKFCIDVFSTTFDYDLAVLAKNNIEQALNKLVIYAAKQLRTIFVPFALMRNRDKIHDFLVYLLMDPEFRESNSTTRQKRYTRSSTRRNTYYSEADYYRYYISHRFFEILPYFHGFSNEYSTDIFSFTDEGYIDIRTKHAPTNNFGRFLTQLHSAYKMYCVKNCKCYREELTLDEIKQIIAPFETALTRRYNRRINNTKEFLNRII